MSEKKPQPGEFWEWAGCRLRIIGTRSNGAVVAEHECGSLEFGCTAGEMKHLPDCDSFEWQPETFPQFYRGDRWADYEAYVRFDSKYEPGKVFYDNGSMVVCENYKFSQVGENCRLYNWRKLTQAEAESRVKKPEPVESPDDWVTQDRVPDRPGIDEWNRTWDGRSTVWEPSLKNEERYMHGHVCAETGSVFHVRCRRRDLPPMPQKTPKRHHVRLFVNEDTGKVLLSGASDFKPLNYEELKHDGTGFYLEDGK